MQSLVRQSPARFRYSVDATISYWFDNHHYRFIRYSVDTTALVVGWSVCYPLGLMRFDLAGSTVTYMLNTFMINGLGLIQYKYFLDRY